MPKTGHKFQMTNRTKAINTRVLIKSEIVLSTRNMNRLIENEIGLKNGMSKSSLIVYYKSEARPDKIHYPGCPYGKNGSQNREYNLKITF